MVLLVVGFFLVLAIRHNASTAASEAFDRVLEASALSIADTVAYVDGEVTVDIPYSAFAILGTSRLTRIFYRVAAPNGEVVTGEPVLGLELGPFSGPEIRFVDSTMQDEPIRLAAVGRYRSDATTGASGWITVLVGETREARDLLTGQLTANAVLPAMAVAICAFGIIWVGIRAAFSPLRSIERNLSQRTPSDLDPISENLPREIAAFARALNGFMERLASTLDGLRRVTADAAHQFRTPLTALRAQAELALEETDLESIRRRLQKIHANAVTASTLATRLLADATLLHAIKSGETRRFDFGALAESVLERTKVDAQTDGSQYAIPFDRPATPVWIDADATSLSEAISNVLDNAFLYGGGPTSIVLTVSNGSAVLKIIDRGPGIPQDQRDIVFERFERNSLFPGGSGLGLAIAKDVVIALGGTITLEDPPDGGLGVVIRVPVSTEGKRPGSRRRRHSASVLTILAALVLSGPWAVQPARAQARGAFSITAPFSPERFRPVIDALSARFGELDFVYYQARSAQVAARLSARAPVDVDLVLMAAPDIAVSITNQGLAAPLGIASLDIQSGSESAWRGELFALAFDPAVILVSKGYTAPVPTTRLDLAQALESARGLFKRAGIVNVGVDAVSYALASQDSLRSPLYWRLAAAFGSSQARIYNTSAELVEAMAAGEIDIAYNVPMSDVIGGGFTASFQVIIPQDYVLGLPWTCFVPATSDSSMASAVAGYLLSPKGKEVVSNVLWRVHRPQVLEIEEQKIALGPELLVYLDSIKRSNFLDAWFELVTSP
ncbi:sensor histidine kinase N-terminal domain-containing protein [Devosia sp. PTR5]|uniref:histidine kinase n=1 Tax=Devosia oryzisoli TaxID=2774138 RepID=A0A927FV60_9HYPH|nr:sensor histidine kinase N-terminal domain-containing protein [Devosia oryzisoli]